MKTLKLLRTKPYSQQLIILSAFCINLLMVRAALTHSIFFFFLIWNLFLAYTPLLLTSLLMNKVQWIEKKLYFYPIFVLWLLLLPNAPYIITDFIHLQRELDVPVWFDVLLLMSFTVNGLLFGLASMKHMYVIIAAERGQRFAKFTIMIVCLLSAYGIYLGRYLRYNSWDILQRPVALALDIATSFTDPAYYKASIGITMGFGVLLYLMFSLYNDTDN